MNTGFAGITVIAPIVTRIDSRVLRIARSDHHHR
jgi:hypothetical protein